MAGLAKTFPLRGPMGLGSPANALARAAGLGVGLRDSNATARTTAPQIEDPLRQMAWIMTAGSMDVVWCFDAHGNKLHRDAEPGSTYGWDADHIIPRELGGTDHPLNLRALHSSANRSDGAYLGNAKPRGLR